MTIYMKKKKFLRAESTFTRSLVRINSPGKHDVESITLYRLCVCVPSCALISPCHSLAAIVWSEAFLLLTLDCFMHENQHHKISKWKAHCSAFTIRSERQTRQVNFTFPSEEKREERSKKEDKHS